MTKRLIEKCKSYKKKQDFIKSWREKNQHNRTQAATIFDINKVRIGRFTYGPLNIYQDDVSLTIGDFCSIGPDVQFILGGEHPTDRFLTYPVDCWILHKKPYNRNKGDIIIEDDVWIGTRCLILSGVHIGKGAIIAAGSVVYKDVPPFAIWGSGKVLKYRFDEETREILLKLDYSKIDEEFIRENPKLFTESWETNNLEVFK